MLQAVGRVHAAKRGSWEAHHALNGALGYGPGRCVDSNGADVMAEESWHEARLIPTSGINGAEEQERRATSALLAVMVAVREFGRALTKPFGAPVGSLEAFIEVPFVLGERRLYPDGLLRVRRGQKSWTALIEVKTGRNELGSEQIENYLDIAREQGFDAVVTISNEIPPVVGQHPTKVDKRGRGRGAFIDSVLDTIDGFYADVMQHLKAWSAAPPKVRAVPEDDAETLAGDSLVSTSLSSQDGAETA